MNIPFLIRAPNTYTRPFFKHFEYMNSQTLEKHSSTLDIEPGYDFSAI